MISVEQAKAVKQIFEEYALNAYRDTTGDLYVIEDYSEDNQFSILSAHYYMMRVLTEMVPYDCTSVDELVKFFIPYKFLKDVSAEFTSPIAMVKIPYGASGYVKPLRMYDGQPENKEFDESSLYVLFRRDSHGIVFSPTSDVICENPVFNAIKRDILEMINAIKDLFKTNLDSDITDQDKAYTLIRKINTMKLENYPDLVDKFIEVLKEYDNKEDK